MAKDEAPVSASLPPDCAAGPPDVARGAIIPVDRHRRRSSPSATRDGVAERHRVVVLLKSACEARSRSPPTGSGSRVIGPLRSPLPPSSTAWECGRDVETASADGRGPPEDIVRWGTAPSAALSPVQPAISSSRSNRRAADYPRLPATESTAARRLFSSRHAASRPVSPTCARCHCSSVSPPWRGILAERTRWTAKFLAERIRGPERSPPHKSCGTASFGQRRYAAARRCARHGPGGNRRTAGGR